VYLRRDSWQLHNQHNNNNNNNNNTCNIFSAPSSKGAEATMTPLYEFSTGNKNIMSKIIFHCWIKNLSSSSSSVLQPWVGLVANVASDFYPGQPPANFYNPVSLRLPVPLQSILISVSHVLADLQGLFIISLYEGVLISP